MSKFITLVFSTLLLLASGSIAAEWKDWDKASQEQFKMFIGLQVVDTYQTMAAIDCQKFPDCPLTEKNPLLGDRPDDDAVILQKVIGSYIIYKLLDRETEHRRGKTLTWINTSFVIVISNNSIQLRKVF